MSCSFYVTEYLVYDRSNVVNGGDRLKTFQEGKLIGIFREEKEALNCMCAYKTKNPRAKMELCHKSAPFIHSEAHIQPQFHTNE